MMEFYRFYNYEEDYTLYGTKRRYVDKIFTLDIETTSFFKDEKGMIHSQKDYDPDLYAKQEISYHACMYIWMIGIDDHVYYGRTWDQMRDFLQLLNDSYPEKKIFFIHNLAFEFQFMRSVFDMDKVFARSQRKPIYCTLADYNIELRCSYFMSNNALKDLPRMFNLPVRKLSGDLDYSVIRHPLSPLTKEEYSYCEHDILVLYEYIKYMLTLYPNTNKIPKTSTGQVRRELQELTQKDYKYRNTVRKAINTDPHVYNLLNEAFAGGYTHANWTHADLIEECVDSYDEASAYPAMICLKKFPGTEFKRCFIDSPEDMLKEFAYIVHVRFIGIHTRLENTLISYSHCRNVINGYYDNGRIIKADEIELVCTDIDLRMFMKAYSIKEIIFEEAYYSLYRYLPKTYVNFVLDKYKKKTTLKGVKEKELEYSKEKNRFNALFGMAVTNTIRNEVSYSDHWEERELTNEEIVNKLNMDKKKAFLSFAYGVWVTAWAREALWSCLIELDPYVIYADTDSLKLLPGYDKTIIKRYNQKILNETRAVCKKLGYKYSDFAPEDIKGKKHPMGIFEYEDTYKLFKTLGAKKYSYVEQDDSIHITLSGVPKQGSSALSKIGDFRKGFLFRHEITGKNNLQYNDDQSPQVLTDFTGKEYTITDKTIACILPADYTLGVTEEYEELFGSERAKYKE